MRWIARFSPAAVAVALAGCGEDREASTGTSTNAKTGTETAAAPKGAPAGQFKIRESEFELAPNEVKVEDAGVYEFDATNVGKTVHALEIEGQGSEVETEEIQPGKSATLKANLKKGKYKLYCPVANHEQQGMTGSVTVGEISGTGTTTSDDKKSDDSGGGRYGY